MTVNIDELKTKLRKVLDDNYSRIEVFNTSGGMSTIFTAHDDALDTDVAIKVLTGDKAPDRDELERFRRGASALAELDGHENICPVKSWKSNPEIGLTCIIMKLIDGESLQGRLYGGPLDVAGTIRLATEMLSALAYAHRHGIVHRDIKPANILIDREGRSWLTDFGIAKKEGAVDLTNPGFGVGTPPYMSPEQAWCREPDRRSDLHSLGLVLAECLTGDRVYPEKTVVEVLERKRSERDIRLELPADCPDFLAGLIRRIVAVEADERPDSAADLLEELRRDCAAWREREENSRTDGAAAVAAGGVGARWFLIAGALAAAWLAWVLVDVGKLGRFGTTAAQGDSSATTATSYEPVDDGATGGSGDPANGDGGNAVDAGIERVSDMDRNALPPSRDPEPNASRGQPPLSKGLMIISVEKPVFCEGGRIWIDGKAIEHYAPKQFRWPVTRGDVLHIEVKCRDSETSPWTKTITAEVGASATVSF